MQKMVLVKYHGIRLGVDEEGNPRLQKKYNAGAPLVLNIGEISDPIPLETARKLKADFGNAFEIVYEADIPETPEEAAEIESATETDSLGVTHIDVPEMEAQEAELEAAKPEDITVTRKVRFDKTLRPIRYSRRALDRMKKGKLKSVYKALRKDNENAPKLPKKPQRKDYIDAILGIQA